MDNFISDYEAACAKLNRSSALPDVSGFNPRLQAYITALHKLDILLEVNNGGVEMNAANLAQTKYYPRFEIIPDASRPFRFRLAFLNRIFYGSGSTLSVRHACASWQLAVFMGKNCAELYEPLMA
jgi:hypothetical protein